MDELINEKCLVGGVINEELDEVIKFNFDKIGLFSAIEKFDDKFVEEVDWSRGNVMSDDEYENVMKRISKE